MMARPAVMTVADTIAKSFLLAVETRGDKTAIREKHLGVWQSTSWRQWLQTAKRSPTRSMRPASSRRCRVHHRQCHPEWVFADMGVLCAGGCRPASSDGFCLAGRIPD